MAAIELLAPAKVNLTLEVLGRRADGYHEILSVMQTIEPADRVRLEEANDLEFGVSGEEVLGVPLEGPGNLAFRAAQLLIEETGALRRGARIELVKAVPAGLGLGGGSSDAAAVLRGLNLLWRLNLSPQSLRGLAPRIGSDVAFFLHGGAALVSGRGDAVDSLPDVDRQELTLFVSAVEISDKTRRMYAALSPADFSDGRRSRVLAEGIRRGLPLTDEDLVNAFDRHIAEVEPQMARAMAACREAGVPVLACGSGPGFFSRTPLPEMPGLLLRQLRREWGVTARAVRTLNREEALQVREL